ncbi:flippase-like domain-containing protein [Thermococcus sp. M36]|nr:flippase-like domain-containing protein [Thermococcus sp. M36]
MVESISSEVSQYFSVLRGASVEYIALALVTYYVSVLLYALRWRLILRGIGREAPMGELVKAIMASIFMNNVTPMSRGGGELLRIAWVSRRVNIPAGMSAVSIVYERILETIPVMVLFLVGLTYFSSEPAVPVAIGAAGIALIWIKWDSFVRVSLRVFRTEATPEELKRITALRSLHNINLAAVGLSSAVWVLDVVRLKLITLAFGLSLSWGLVAVVSVANLVLGLMAFTPGGIGIIEGGLVGTLIHFGLPSTLAVSVTLLERLVSYVISSAVGFLVLLTSGGVEIWRALRSQ